MFYRTRVSITEPADPVSALVALTPSESKRVIAKGVAALPEVKRAMERGLIVVGRGTTNAFVAEELTGEKTENKNHYAAGFIVCGQRGRVGELQLRIWRRRNIGGSFEEGRQVWRDGSRGR
jgi:hypothetical protein